MMMSIGGYMSELSWKHPECYLSVMCVDAGSATLCLCGFNSRSVRSAAVEIEGGGHLLLHLSSGGDQLVMRHELRWPNRPKIKPI